MKKISTKKLVILGLMCALAYIIVSLIRIPIMPALPFLKYEPKDVIITIGGFIYGPITAFVISGVVSLVEMVTISDTGPIGLIMNIISTCSFACTAAVIYKKKHTLSGAIIGLIAGTVLMTALMLLWNYLITPHYMGIPRDAVKAMLLPAFMPFNLIKGTLNAIITILIYKPCVIALRKSRLLPESEATAHKHSVISTTLICLLLLASISLVVLVMRGVI